MFNNLIESSSHTKEYKRRGSFLLFTGATYVVLFAITGVASIYAYDAHLEAQTESEVLSWLPQLPTEVIADVERAPHHASSNTTANTTRPTRPVLVDSTSNPLNPPPQVGATGPTIPPAPRDAVIGPEILDPVGPPAGSRGAGGTGNRPVQIDIPDPPPAAPAPTPKPVVPSVLKVSRVLNSQALLLPKPNYPPLARNIRLQGSVIVQVLIDESGKVISAKVTSGHPLFVAEAQKAAMGAQFSPTLIGDTPVKVSGVITYKFEMNQ